MSKSEAQSNSHPCPKLGFLGLGSMGSGMAGCLLRGGNTVTVYDPLPDKIAGAVAVGASPAKDVADVLENADIVLTSLPSPSSWMKLVEESILPNCRVGQVFIDLGTVEPYVVRKVAEEFTKKGAWLLDVPVSGGIEAAKHGSLLLMAGGERKIFDRVFPVLELLGAAGSIQYCGPSGAGQAAKGVNQLAMGLPNAAFLEAIAFGVGAGLSVETIKNAVGGETGWRANLSGLCEKIISGKGDAVGIKAGQYGEFLNEAQERGFELPITCALAEFLKDAPATVREANRISPSLWRELQRGDAKRQG